MYQKPWSDADAPSVDPGVLARMKRLDRQLHVTWTRYTPDPITGQPAIGIPGVDPHTGDYIEARPIEDPAFHLWRQDETSSQWHWVSSYAYFGHQQVAKLEADVARYMNPDEIMRARAAAIDARFKRVKDARDEQHVEKLKANRSVMNDTLFGKNRQHRDGRIFSGAGVKYRGGSGTVERSQKEMGWELPENPNGD